MFFFSSPFFRKWSPLFLDMSNASPQDRHQGNVWLSSEVWSNHSMRNAGTSMATAHGCWYIASSLGCWATFKRRPKNRISWRSVPVCSSVVFNFVFGERPANRDVFLWAIDLCWSVVWNWHLLLVHVWRLAAPTRHSNWFMGSWRHYHDWISRCHFGLENKYSRICCVGCVVAKAFGNKLGVIEFWIIVWISSCNLS